MSTMPQARLRILDRPDLGQDARRFEVGCRFGTSSITTTPGNELPDSVMILIAARIHEEQCGGCDLSAVLDRGDQPVRELFDAVRVESQAAAMAARRN